MTPDYETETVFSSVGIRSQEDRRLQTGVAPTELSQCKACIELYPGESNISTSSQLLVFLGKRNEVSGEDREVVEVRGGSKGWEATEGWMWDILRANPTALARY